MREFSSSVRLPVPAAEAFAWHERPGAMERMTPPWEHVQVLERSGTIRDGDRVLVKLGAFRMEHVHKDFIPGRQFRDEQVKGPFRTFIHTHEIVPVTDTTSELRDHIHFELPRLGGLAAPAVRARMQRGFTYRHATLVHDLARHAEFRGRPRLRVAITGASGVIGSALTAFLTTGGHEVLRLVRRAAGPGEIAWDPARGSLPPGALDGVDAVVHLAGENIGGRRWNADRKRSIIASRVEGTSLIARTLAAMRAPPPVLVTASAVGIYGSHDPSADEDSPPGDDFLAEVCTRWEAAAEPARAAGLRVVTMRIGVVMTPAGGALAEMLPLFRLGLGGKLGSGAQMISWISLDDTLGAILHALLDDRLRSVVNATAPHPVSNAELTTTLARVLRRPTLLRVPAFAIRARFGEMGELLALGGAAVAPRRLTATGFRYIYPDLEPALRHVLGRQSNR